MAAATARQILRREGLHLVGEALTRQSAVAFNRAFAAAGLDRKVLRFGFIIDKTVICSIGAEASDNLFPATHYFGVQNSRFNDDFRELYHEAFGASAPPISAATIGYYEALHALARLVRNTDFGPGRWLAAEVERAGALLQTLKPGDAHPDVFLGAAHGVTLQVVAQLAH